MQQRLRGDARRDQIARAVLALAAEKGLDSVSVARVARHVGVTPSALYRHFPSKEAMLEATVERLVDRVMGNVERARSAASDPLDALGRLLVLHVAVVRENRGMPHLLFSETLSRHHILRARYLSLIERFRAAVMELIRAGRRSGHIRPDLDPQTGAMMFIGLFLPSAILWNLTDGHFDITAQVRRNWRIYREVVGRAQGSDVSRSKRPGAKRSTSPARRSKRKGTP